MEPCGRRRARRGNAQRRVKLTVPSNYSAELETGTLHGGFQIDFPITVSGRLSRHLTTMLGAGGPKIRAMTQRRRHYPPPLNASRKRRVSSAAVPDVVRAR